MLDSSRKVVVVGDGMVGKTALLAAYINGRFETDYIPTVFETTAKEIELTDGRRITLGLWDTGGQEEFDQIRQLAYPGASLILMCYAVDCPTSLDNITQTWLGEVRNYCPNVPLILVGCKADRRGATADYSHESFALVDPDTAQWISKQIRAQVHIECSAFHRSNVDTVFELAARIILDTDLTKHRVLSLRRMLSFKSDRQMSNGYANRSPHEGSLSGKRVQRTNLWCFTKR
ncbi:unnamed protein product [Calicophoron daubneyi]|uniref:Uncharacterized protein n=1 Tax=Calicophoron daubneyi TaxID=300641 RepID=A0AAV2T8P6_CALDB